MSVIFVILNLLSFTSWHRIWISAPCLHIITHMDLDMSPMSALNYYPSLVGTDLDIWLYVCMLSLTWIWICIHVCILLLTWIWILLHVCIFVTLNLLFVSSKHSPGYGSIPHITAQSGYGSMSTYYCLHGYRYDSMSAYLSL